MKKILFFIGLFGFLNLVYAENIGSEVVGKEKIIEALKPAIVTRGVRVNDDESQGTLSMQVLFAFDSDQLTQGAVNQLVPLGQALSSEELSGYKFLIEGHTDAVGSDAYNMSLSNRRAIAVGQFLYDNFNINVDSLRLVGRGEHVLLNKNDPDAEENRRVVITTLVE